MILSTALAAALTFACSSDEPKNIPEYGNHGGGETPVTPVEPTQVDTNSYCAALKIISATADECGIAVKYSIDDTLSLKNADYGLVCVPVVEDAVYYPSLADASNVFHGPIMTAGDTILQVIPAVGLGDPVQKVYVYLKNSEGTVYSSECANCTLSDQPDPITLTWEKLSAGSLPSAIEIYHTTTQIDSKNFEAWYAVADLSGVNVKIKIPSSTATVDAQAEADASTLVLVNGGYFYSGKHVGYGAVDGVQVNATPSVRGSLNSSHPEYSVMYNVTRGTFLLDTEGKPWITWSGTDTRNVTHFYNRPLASIIGEARYGAVTGTLPVPEQAIKPGYAVSAGPVLLYSGRIPFNFDETGKGDEYYYHNYEVMPYDIFGSTTYADRTCVGLRPDGKVILFICDGRIKSSRGLNLLQLARIMLGLGCTYAVNMDGGGSTAMWALGEGRLNSMEKDTAGALENRPVVSTIGFYKK